MYLIVVICGIGVSSYIIMIIAGLKIRSFVTKRHINMSTKNAQAFNMMVKALVIQSFIPVFFSFPTKILYMLLQFTSFRWLIAEYIIFAISPVLAVIDPCITLYYVLPYRRYLVRKLGFVKNVVPGSSAVGSPQSWSSSRIQSARAVSQQGQS
ncbi:unnamed protein product [Strongylus vulgaris]|uniref:G-protein coupled receptors family 1 profile domain-containing protein n=1 Tax=Strongylus vulgaris TaxID=40348 RepID=A0A3P7JUC0_STRVU|nr:unnamed protein product [Strongylus vulgaris]